MELKTDYEFKSKIPPLTGDELMRLHESISSEGRLINPIVVWNGIIVDGHNRYEYVSRHPEITYDIYEKDFDNRSEAIAWICKNQLGRRNLTPEQKKYLIGKQYEAEKGSRGGDRKSMYQNDTQKSENTGERIARENNMSRISVLRAEEYANAVDIADEAAPGIKKEILSGSIPATNAEIVKIASTAPEERASYAEKLRQPKPQKLRKNRTTEKIVDSVLPIEPKCKKPERPTIEDELCEIAEGIDELSIRWGDILTHNKDRYHEPEFFDGMHEYIEELYDYLKQVEIWLNEGKAQNSTQTRHTPGEV